MTLAFVISGLLVCLSLWSKATDEAIEAENQADHAVRETKALLAK